jgi:hypothetical protein
MRHKNLAGIACLVLLAPAVTPANAAPQGIAGMTTFHTTGSGDALVSIPVDTRVSVASYDILGGLPNETVVLWFNAPDFALFSLGDGTDLDAHFLVRPGVYRVVVVASPGVEVTLHAVFENIAGEADILLSPVAGAYVLPLHLVRGVASLPGMVAVERGQGNSATRSVVITHEVFSMIGTVGGVVMTSRHSVHGSILEHQCEPAFLGAILTGEPLYHAYGGGTRLFVRQGVWSAEVDYVAPGTAVTLTHKSYAINIPLLEGESVNDYDLWGQLFALWPLSGTPREIQDAVVTAACVGVPPV